MAMTTHGAQTRFKVVKGVPHSLVLRYVIRVWERPSSVLYDKNITLRGESFMDEKDEIERLIANFEFDLRQSGRLDEMATEFFEDLRRSVAQLRDEAKQAWQDGYNEGYDNATEEYE